MRLQARLLPGTTLSRNQPERTILAPVPLRSTSGHRAIAEGWTAHRGPGAVPGDTLGPSCRQPANRQQGAQRAYGTLTIPERRFEPDLDAALELRIMQLCISVML